MWVLILWMGLWAGWMFRSSIVRASEWAWAAFWGSRFGHWLWHALCRWLEQVVWLLEYEPTWFPEFGLAVSAVGWGLGAFITDDLLVEGMALLLPCGAIILGVVRCLALLRLWYGARVVLASVSFLLWAWIYIAVTAKYGVLPIPQLLVGAMLMELLTALKFSIPCARELVEEWQVWRGRKRERAA